MSSSALVRLFLALYLLECVAWVGQGGRLLLRWPGGPWRWRRRGLHLKPPWPGGSAVYLDQEPGAAPPAAALVDALSQRLRRLQEAQRQHNALGWALAVQIVLLALLWRLDPRPYRIEAILAMLGLALLTHGLQAWTLARSWPALGLPAEGRKAVLWICAASPWASIRAADLLGRHALLGVDPFAAAQAALPEDERRRLAAERLRTAHFPRKADPRLDERAWDAWARAQGWDPAQLLAPPAPESGARAWCPRCLQQYQRAGDCSDCRLALKPHALSPH